MQHSEETEEGGTHMEGRAWFVRRPARLEDLQAIHPLDEERPCRAVAEVTLGDMDFQNFITDLYADRAFVEEYAPLCSEGEVWNCILVRCRGDRNGILVMPEAGCFVGWAAWTEVEP